MKKILLILITIIAITSFGCKKSSSSDPVYTLKGKLYKNCSKSVMANTRITLFDPTVTGGGGFPTSGPFTLGEDTTDADGNFQIDYKSDGRFHPDAQILVNGSAVLRYVTTDKSFENLEVFNNSTCPVTVTLVANKPYTSSDTLVLNDIRTYNSFFKIAGPFTNQVLYSVSNYSINLPIFTNDSVTDSLRIGYKINPINTTDQHTWNLSTNSIKSCNATNVVITIN